MTSKSEQPEEQKGPVRDEYVYVKDVGFNRKGKKVMLTFRQAQYLLSEGKIEPVEKTETTSTKTTKAKG